MAGFNLHTHSSSAYYNNNRPFSYQRQPFRAHRIFIAIERNIIKITVYGAMRA